MASSFWAKNYNLSIKHEVTKKQYYGRYLWRLVYNIKKVSLVNDKYVADIINHVREQRIMAQMTRGNAYSRYHVEDWEGVDSELLDRIRTVTNTFKDVVKFRCEWHTMQVYAESEQDLRRVADAIAHSQDITIINGPRPGTEDALRNGHVFMNKIDYKYKIVLRDGNYDQQTKQNILHQLDQREDVKIPANLRRELGKKYPALWGAYFYSNDDSIVTVLSLISPGLIGKIHPINQLQ